MRRKPRVATMLVGALLGAVWAGRAAAAAGAATEGAPSNRGWTTSIDHADANINHGTEHSTHDTGQGRDRGADE